jgi:hypothetical protein
MSSTDPAGRVEPIDQAGRRPPSDDSSVVAGASRVAGGLLEGVFASVARLRPAAKPLHPRGETRAAIVTRSGLEPATGVPWIDEAGVDDAQVRLSRAVGLPPSWPDIFGLALRVPTSEGFGDVLFATTGRGTIGRFVLLPGRSTTSWTYTTLIPYRTASGPLLLAAHPDGEGTFTVACARPTGTWQPFGRIVLEPPPAAGTDDLNDVGPAFDPVLNQLPGLAYYPWAARLREGSYRAARRSRGSD